MEEQGSVLKNVVHQDGTETRKLHDVRILSEDDWSLTFQRPGGQVVRISKAYILRIEDA